MPRPLERLVPGLLAALLLATTGTAASAAATAPSDDRQSLEELLQRARVERERVQAGLSTEVQGILSELESLSPRTAGRRADERRERLLELGPEVGPLLLGALDPGRDSTAGEVFRARQVVLVLRELNTVSITDELLELTGTGTREGRMNALSVLETSSEPDRVAPAVGEIYRSATGELRETALLTLARLGGPLASKMLATALNDDDDAIVDVAIRALVQVESETVSAQVLTLVRGERGPKHVDALIAFYSGRRGLLSDEDHVEGLVVLVQHPDTPRKQAVALLETLAELEVDLKTATKKALEPLTEHVNDDLREASLVLLARAKDKGARRSLLKEYNDKVNRQKDFDGVYTDRGDVYYRIGEYKSAITDYKQAIKLLNSRSRTSRKPEPFLGLARCYARMNRFKDAADYLNGAPVSLTTLRELAADPAFKEMLETKYAEAFYLPPD